MKRSDLKELIKKSMLEVSPKSGAMTPEEEKMVADYEEEEANKYALDKEEPMEEDVLREADEIVAAYAEKKTIKEEGILGATTVGGGETDTVKTDATSQALLGAIAKMSDSYLALANHINKAYPQAFSDPKVSMYMNGIAQEIKTLKQLKQGLKEEMHGGYLELLEMNPAFDEGVASLLQAWNDWKEGDETEPYMVEEAKQDVLAYLSSMMS